MSCFSLWSELRSTAVVFTVPKTFTTSFTVVLPETFWKTTEEPSETVTVREVFAGMVPSEV